MSWTWFIYTPLSARESLSLIEDVGQRIDAWIAAHGQDGADEYLDTCGHVEPGGPVPSIDEVVQANAHFGMGVSPTVLGRLPSCRSSIAIDRIRDSGLEHPLQVSILRYLLEHVGRGLVNWGDHQMALTERALADLERVPDRGRLDPRVELATPSRRSITLRKDRPGEMRAVRILEAFERCVGDPDAKIDLERLLASCTPEQLEYIALLRSTGAVDDAAAAASLAMTTREIDLASAGLEAELKKLVEG